MTKQQKTYSMEEVDTIMKDFIEKTADDLVVELRKNWKKQNDTTHV